MKKNNLGKEEMLLEESFARDEWISHPHLADRQREVQEIAANTIQIQKSKSITLRVNEDDLLKLRAKAIKKNIPYQTLLGVLIREYVDGDYSVKL